MKYLLSLLATAFYLLPASAQLSNEELFAQAGSAYNRGDYQEAVDNYQRILAKGKASASLYYNLANAYYKQEEVGEKLIQQRYLGNWLQKIRRYRPICAMPSKWPWTRLSPCLRYGHSVW